MRALAVLVALGLALASAVRAGEQTAALAGSFQSELGCPGDWDPACPLTDLAYDPTDGVWQQTFSMPAGPFDYKVALNDSWNEAYPTSGLRSIDLPLPGAVKFYFDPATHWIADTANEVIAVVPGDFQNELGCLGDWQPDCLRSWLEDPDGDGVYSFATAALAAGAYECKVAIGESWDENYGADGVPGGANVPFVVAANGDLTTFTYDAATHVLTVVPEPGVAASSPIGVAALVAVRRRSRS